MRHRLVFYRSVGGEQFGQWYPIDEVPLERMSINGVLCSLVKDKVEESLRRSSRLQLIMDERPHVSHAAPRWHGVRAGKGRGIWSQYDKKGRPVIASKQEYREAQRRAADMGETINRVNDMGGLGDDR